MINAAVIGFLKRSQKTRVSSGTSREGGGAVGINLGSSNLASGRLMPRDRFSCKRGFENRYARDKASHGDTIPPMNAFWNSFETFLGLGVEPKDLTFVQISLRAIIVFLVTLITMRLGHKRSLSRKTPFDAVLLVILAAVLSRAVNGSATFSPHSAEAWFWCCSQGLPFSFTTSCTWSPAAIAPQKNQLDSFADLFSAVLVWPGEELFAASFEAADFSPPSPAFGADSFFAASLYDRLR